MHTDDIKKEQFEVGEGQQDPEEQQTTHWKEQYMRIVADFDNFKKRLEKERLQTARIIKGSIVLDLFPIVDNFERALASGSQDPETFRGYEMIYKELVKMLKKQGVEEIPYSKTFDPELFEAIMNVPSESHTSGEVVAILQKGYTIDGAVVRPAQVSVAT